MAEYRGIDLLDYFVLIVKNKKLLIVLSIITLAVSYTAIYFFVPPQYEAKATLISMEDSFGPSGMLSKNLENLPLSSLGIGGISPDEKYDLFTTLIYSRNNLEHILKDFNLMKDYGAAKIELALKTLRKKISVEVTTENSYEITVEASSPQKAADITNYIVEEVNKNVIELNIKKSKENRYFLEKRYYEIKKQLEAAEDSLQFFQKNTGMLEVESQTKAIIETFSKLEADLAKRQVEYSILKEIMGENNINTQNVKVEVNEYEKKLEDLRELGGKNKLLLSLNSLPEKVMSYSRHFRDIEIYNSMLEFIIPLYEKAKYEEINAMPVLQVIDYAIPPEKKSFPPRVIFAILITIFVFSSVTLFLFFKEILFYSTNSKLVFIKNELLNFRNKK